MKKPVAKATGFFYVRRPGKLANGRPLRCGSPVRAGMRTGHRAPPPLSQSPRATALAGMAWQYPGPQKTKGPVAGALSGAFGVEVYGFEEGMFQSTVAPSAD